MNKFMFNVLVILLLSSGFPFSSIAQVSSPKTDIPSKSGFGVDIIQGFSDSEVIVRGKGCGKIHITILCPKGNVKLKSPVLEGSQIDWTFCTGNWESGIYMIIVDSSATNCKLNGRRFVK